MLGDAAFDVTQIISFADDDIAWTLWPTRLVFVCNDEARIISTSRPSVTDEPYEATLIEAAVLALRTEHVRRRILESMPLF